MFNKPIQTTQYTECILQFMLIKLWIVRLSFCFTGQTNCPSGIDESEKECGTAHKLLELPGGIFAAMGGVAAIFAVCFLICILCMVRGKKNKSVATSKSINGLNTASQIDFRKDPLFIDDGSWQGLHSVEYIHVDRETTV